MDSSEDIEIESETAEQHHAACRKKYYMRW